ncbi:MAG: NFACT RNA binding domain-containing protein [Desulfovibrio sp.]|jgi:hypothetical protein|nr:NFACT RNA binding domain-containing protein [Desulfovibrio sp.]
MDSHVFRILAAEAARMLEGARLEKIRGPRPDVLVFIVFAAGLKRRLVLRFGRRAPLLFFSEQVPENPPAPPASVMRLRKYCAGRRLGRAQVDHISRCIAFPVAGASARDSRFLLLDMAHGAFAPRELPENFGQAPARPGSEIIEALCGRAWDKKENQGPWREFPVLTPLLRETLSFLDPLEGLALAADLERGGGDLFLYADAAGCPSFYSAWPLPEAQARRRGLSPFVFPTSSGEAAFGLCREQTPDGGGGRGSPDVREAAPQFTAATASAASMRLGAAGAGGTDGFTAATASVASLLPAYPALAGVSLVAAPLFCAELGGEERRKQGKPAAAARRKAEKLAAKLREEELRLRGMVELGATAEAIKALLWRFPADAAPAEIDVPTGDGSAESLRITLDPRFSLRENMNRMFREATRGKRGLEMLRRRRNGEPGAENGAGRVCGATAVNAEAGRVSEEFGINTGAGQVSEESELHVGTGRVSGNSAVKVAAMLPASGAGGRELRGVARFRSSDGFLLWRGRNAAGNALLLKSGAAHDYWLHAEGFPGAHVLIRRSHAAEPVPERTLREAAALAAEKSAAQGWATVMVALLRHVRRNAKGTPGVVEIASVLRRIRVDDTENTPAEV